MRRGTIFVVLFIVVVAGILLFSRVATPPESINVEFAVSPLVAAWVQPVVDAYNAEGVILAGRPARVTLVSVDDLETWQPGSTRVWTASDHPDAWIPAVSMSADYLTLPVSWETISPSLGSTLLVWGGYSERVDLLANVGVGFNWDTVAAAAAVGNWADVASDPEGNRNVRVNLAFQSPGSSMNGLAVVFSAAAHFDNTTTLAGLASTYRQSLLPVICRVPGFQTLSANPALDMAARRSVADIGLLPESLWLTNLSRLTRSEDFTLAYPRYSFTFDFPLLFLADTETDPLTRQVVEELAGRLQSAGQQRTLLSFGMRPQGGLPEVGGGLDVTATLFVAAVDHGLQVQPVGEPITQLPSRDEILSVLNWFNGRRCP